MVRVIVLAVLTLGIQAGILFGAAGTLDWPMAWVYLLVQAVVMLVVGWLGDPEMLRTRGRFERHAKRWDVALAGSSGMLFWPIPMAVSGLDYGRFRWSPALPVGLTWAALGVFILGMALGVWAMITNRFFAKFVCIQKDRGHHVISGGPYAYVRHPGYACAFVAFSALPVALGSLWALIPALLGLALLVLRTYLEDRTLKQELVGYQEYATRVRYRLVPGIW